MKTLLLNLFIVFNLSALSQTQLPDNFKIGNYVEVFNKDSIKIYYNCGGAVVDKKCAEYYRVGKMDTEIINVVGDFQDYYINNKPYLKGSMLNNLLEGPAQYFYENGQVKEEGTYLNNIRQGKWTFYYANGQVEKVYHYTDGHPDILEAYNPNGKATVVNGNGAIKIHFSLYKQCNKFEIKGKLLNGKKNGAWTYSNIGANPFTTEVFEEGKFIKGQSNNHQYTDGPKIVFTDFYGSEHLDLVEGRSGCSNSYIAPAEYNKKPFYLTLYPELQSKLTNYTGAVKNQWVVVGITISNKNKLAAVHVASSINDTLLEKHIHNLIYEMNHWQSAEINSKKIVYDIFFTVLVDNNQIIIPADYLYGK